MSKEQLFKSMKTIASILFLCFSLTAQGQEMLRYEPTPTRPLQVPNSPQRQSPQQPQQSKQQAKIVRVTGYYYEENTPEWGQPTSYSLRRASLKVKITDSYNGEVYTVTEYKTNDSQSWQPCYGCSVGYDKNEEAYYVNAGITKIYFNL